MTKFDDSQWWHPNSGFFSPDFYLKGDYSKKGFSSGNPLTIAQRTQKEIDFVVKHLKPKNSSKILDCPCGYGRHAIELASRGYQVVGADINTAFLEIAMREAEKFSLQEKVQFVECNMLNQNWEPGRFDFIINMFTSFGFFESDEENKRVLFNFSEALKNKGKLLLYFDYNPDRIINHRYFNGDENLFRKCLFNGAKYDLTVDEKYDNKRKRLIGSWTLRNGGTVTKSYSIRIYSNKELKTLLNSIGFQKVDFFDPNNKSFNDNSKETIVVATR